MLSDLGRVTEADVLFADSLGLARFHLLFYSGGGLVSLTLTGAHPECLPCLALFEPASIPGRLSAEEAELYRRLETELAGKSGPDFMRIFMTPQVRDGVHLGPARRTSATVDGDVAAWFGLDDGRLRRPPIRSRAPASMRVPGLLGAMATRPACTRRSGRES